MFMQFIDIIALMLFFCKSFFRVILLIKRLPVPKAEIFGAGIGINAFMLQNLFPFGLAMLVIGKIGTKFFARIREALSDY